MSDVEDDSTFASLMNAERPKVQASSKASSQASKLAIEPTDSFERIRRAVKEIGKESGGYRFSAVEKEQLADTVYAFRKQGVTTDQNQIVRIAVNYLLEDLKENGDTSILAETLERLNA